MKSQRIIYYYGLIILFIQLGFNPQLYSQRVEYMVTKITPRTAGDMCVVNDSGVVAGVDLNEARVFIWHQDTITYLPLYSGATYYSVSDINDNSEVVGGASIPSTQYQKPLKWSNGVITDLTSGNGSTIGGYSSGINSSGVVTGVVWLIDNSQCGFLYEDSLSLIQNLVALYSTNDSGYAVGYNSYDQGQTIDEAILYTNGNIIRLRPGIVSSAIKINNANQILGWDYPYLFWTMKNSTITYLPENLFALSQNDSGVIVGRIYSTNGDKAVKYIDNELFYLDSLISPDSEVRLIQANDINNRGEIVCVGQPNGSSNYYIYLLTPDTSKIIRPVEGDTWIAGEQDTIKWKNVWDDKNLIINYSTNAGNTWWLIASGVSGNDQAYVWDIPDGILSTKCLVMIKDYTTGDTLAVSETFKIKPYILTRTDPTTENFIAYDIDTDRWGFENDSADVWPEWWYERFDYAGIDPFTGLEYPQWIGEDSTFSNAWGFNYSDWPSFVRSFSVAACYRNITQGIYNIKALKKWGSEAEEWGGSCFGIAGTNALAFMHRDEFYNKFPVFPNFVNPVSVTPDSGVINAVAEIFSHQFGNPTQINDISGDIKTANQTLRDIKIMFRNSNDARTISLINQNGDGAHTILPYKLQKDPSIGHYYYLYVYDNSFSSVPNAKIKFDTTANGNTGSWEPMYGWANWGGNYGIYLEVPSEKYLNYAELEESGKDGSDLILASNDPEVRCSGGTDILIANPLNEQIGHLNGQLINEMPGAYPLRIKNGAEIPPYGYRLPENNYLIKTSNFSGSKTSVDISAGNKFFTVSREGVSLNQTDKIYYSAGQRIGITNSQGESLKRFKFSEIISDVSQDKMFIVRNLNMDENDSLDFINPENDKLKITNLGSDKNYEIELQYANDQKMNRFLNGSVSLPSTSAHILIPDWTDINHRNLIVLVDIGNNGTIDDTLEIINQITSVGEDQGQLIPDEFQLLQNYPNPFNPTTTINFSITKEIPVNLSVYNILGERVKELKNEVMKPGYYKVEFNATTLASGIYFYRIKAGDFIQTKKMILLK